MRKFPHPLLCWFWKLVRPHRTISTRSVPNHRSKTVACLRRSRLFRQCLEISFVALCSQSWSTAMRIISTAQGFGRDAFHRVPHFHVVLDFPRRRRIDSKRSLAALGKAAPFVVSKDLPRPRRPPRPPASFCGWQPLQKVASEEARATLPMQRPPEPFERPISPPKTPAG